jgi:chromosome segregation ATPase
MNEKPMEPRIAAIETDIGNIKGNIAKLFEGMKIASDAITKLLTGQAELKGDINTLRAETGTVRAEMGTIRAEMGTLRAEIGTLREEMNGRLEALEGKIQRWFVATALSCAGLAFAAARLFH